MPQAAAFDPSQPFQPVAAFDPLKPFTRADDPTPDFRATNEPPSAWLKAGAYGKDAASLALDALPGAGAVIGGVLATPETLGAGTLVGSALGAGAGRGARDFLKAAFGFERPTTALDEAGRIAQDTAETYLVGKILPALWEGIKNPRATVGDVYGEMASLYKGLPKAVKALLPDIEAYRANLPKPVLKAPAAILQRPAWQGWDEPGLAPHLDRSVPVPASSLTQEQLAERIRFGQNAPPPAAGSKPPIRVTGPMGAPVVEPAAPAATPRDVPAPPVASRGPSAGPAEALAAKGQPQPTPRVLDPTAQAIRDQTATAGSPGATTGNLVQAAAAKRGVTLTPTELRDAQYVMRGTEHWDAAGAEEAVRRVVRDRPTAAPITPDRRAAGETAARDLQRRLGTPNETALADTTAARVAEAARRRGPAALSATPGAGAPPDALLPGAPAPPSETGARSTVPPSTPGSPASTPGTASQGRQAEAAAKGQLQPAAAPPELTVPEKAEYLRLRQAGQTHPEALDAIQAQQAFQARYGTPTPTVAQTPFPTRRRGPASGAAGRVSQPALVTPVQSIPTPEVSLTAPGPSPLPDSIGARLATAEGAAKVEAARLKMKAAINADYPTPRERVDAIAAAREDVNQAATDAHVEAARRVRAKQAPVVAPVVAPVDVPVAVEPPPAADVPPAPVKRTRIAKAQVDAPIDAAQQVTNQIARTVDVAGVKTGAEVQRRVVAALEQELGPAQEAAGFKTLEYRPSKAYGGREGAVLVDGEPLARVDRYGKMSWLDDTPSYTTAAGQYVPSEPSARGPIRIDNPRSEMTPSEVGRAAVTEVSRALGTAKKVGQIQLDIPGDGTFTVDRTPHAIQTILDRIRAAPSSVWGGVGDVKFAPPRVGPQIPKATW